MPSVADIGVPVHPPTSDPKCMDPTSPSAPDPLVAILRNIAIDKTAAGDIFKKLMLNNYNKKEKNSVLLEPSNSIDVQNDIKALLSGVVKDDRSGSNVSKSTGEVDSDPVLQDVIPGNAPSCEPVDANNPVSSESSSLIQPPDLVNAKFQNVDLEDTLTHDHDIWGDFDNYTKPNYATFINTTRSNRDTVDEYGSVSLEKISDSSNDLDESSCLHQETMTSFFQCLLTTPNDDYVPVLAAIFLNLPHELMERILVLLDAESMLACRLVCKEFNELFRTSTLLQYSLACKTAGVIDNAQSPFSYAERLKALFEREAAWRSLKPVFETTIKIFHRPISFSISDLTGHTYLLNDSSQKNLQCCHLPSDPQDIPRWTRLPGQGPEESRPGILVSFARDLNEHDLIVNIMSSEVGNEEARGQYSLDLILLKFSTREYHPLARYPRIHLQILPEEEPWIMSKVVGDNLAVIVHSGDSTFSDKLFIFDWKTGHRRLEHKPTDNGYLNLVFISPELLLVPNHVLSLFEIWYIPPSHPNCKFPVQILALKIPMISPEYSLLSFSCRGEPNPILHSMPCLPPGPFFPSPDSSIIIARIRISSILSFPGRPHASYNLIMHRRGLLDMIQKWMSASRQEGLTRWLTNEVTVHEAVDPEDGSLRPDVKSKSISMLPHPGSSARTCSSPTLSNYQTPPNFPVSIFPDSFSSSDSSGSSEKSSPPQYTFRRVPWSEWGPPISRWFQINETQAHWLTYSTGQRYAFWRSNPRDVRKQMVSVADFNPYNFKRIADMIARLRGEPGEGNDCDESDEEEKEEKEKEGFELLDHEGVFLEEVYMGLKCVIHHAPDEYECDVVLMDQERLLGLKLDHEGREESVKVLYFG